MPHIIFPPLALDILHPARDVNDYKKIIRRMYKFIKQEQEIADVEYFLYQSPLLIRAKLPERVIEIESEIMKYLCEKNGKISI